MVTLTTFIIFEILVWVLWPGTPASALSIGPVTLDIGILLVIFSVLIAIRGPAFKIPYGIRYLFLLFSLNIPAVYAGYIPTLFNIKLSLIILGYCVGYNDYRITSMMAYRFICLFGIGVLAKFFVGMPYYSPVHFFNTNEAVLILGFLSSMMFRESVRKNLLVLVVIILTKSRSGLVAYIGHGKFTVTYFLLILIPILILLTTTNLLDRFYLIASDLECFFKGCEVTSSRINFLLEGVNIISNSWVWGLTAEYHDHLAQNWRGYYIYSPHFGLAVLFWGYGALGSLLVVLVTFKLLKSIWHVPETRHFVAFAFILWMFNDFYFSYLFWTLLAISSKGASRRTGAIRERKAVAV